VASVKDIKLRIRAIKNTQQITKAMKMVAAARIRRAENKVKASRPYTEKMGEMVANLIGSTAEPHPFFSVRPPKQIALLLVTADKGLCGSYNSNLLRLAQNLISRKGSARIDLITVGNKGKGFFSKRGRKTKAHFVPSFYPVFEDAKKIAELIIPNFLKGEWDEVRVIYSRFISAINQKPTETLLLPLSSEAGRKKTEFFYEPSAEAALSLLLPKYIQVLLFNALLEARAAELGARLVAMGNATDNAKKLIDSLTLEFYRARQESITKEILEVASGAEALKG